MSWRPLAEVLPVVQNAAPSDAPPEPTLSLASAGGAARAYGMAAQGGAAPASMARPAFAQAAASSTPQPANLRDDAAAAHEQSKQQGYEEGAALARAEHEAVALRYRNAIEELVLAREQTIAACEADLVRLALAIAREVLMADVCGKDEFAARMAEHALQALSSGEPIVLRMHPRDAHNLRHNKPELLMRADVKVLESDEIELGGVIAEGAKGRIEATIEARLAELRDKLLPAGAEPAPEPGA